MKVLVRLLRTLDALQHRRVFKIAATAVVAIALGALWMYLQRADAATVPTLLSPDEPGTMLLTLGLTLGWCLLVIWMGLSLSFIGIALGTGVFVGVALLIGWPGLALAVAGVGVLSFTFLMLIRALLLLYHRPNQIFAIAHTVIKESVRLRISVFFIILLLVLLPIMPLVVSTEEALRYRIQSFIQYSMGLTFYLAAFMTIFLACATVSFEIRDRQIWQLMTKPVSRMNYLLGKWLGIVSVNLVLLLVAGISIFMFVQYLRTQPAANQRDYYAVHNEVLVARDGVAVHLERMDPELLRARVEETIDRDFTLQQQIANEERTQREIERSLAQRINDEYNLRQRTVDPGTMKRYEFRGLRGVKEAGYNLRLRYRIHYFDESTHRREPITFVFFKEGQQPRAITQEYTPTLSHFLEMTSEVIDEDGTIRLGVVNGYVNQSMQAVPGPDTPYSLNFDPDDLEVLYVVGGFEANYFRAVMITWTKLAFLAMLGLAAATVLSFPIATLVTFTVFLAAVIAPFLNLSLEVFEIHSYWRVDRILIKAIAMVMVFLFEPFGAINPTQRLVEGRIIEWMTVIRAVAVLGVLWTGITMGLGYLAFKDRELATYSGQG